MISLLIAIVIAAIVFGLIYWILQQIPIPEPFGRIARVVVVVIFCLYLLNALLGIVPLGNLHRL